MTDIEKQIETAKIFGLFESMIQDIPSKIKRKAHYDKLAKLQELGIVGNFDFSGGCLHFNKEPYEKGFKCLDCNVMFFDFPLNGL